MQFSVMISHVDMKKNAKKKEDLVVLYQILDFVFY